MEQRCNVNITSTSFILGIFICNSAIPRLLVLVALFALFVSIFLHNQSQNTISEFRFESRGKWRHWITTRRRGARRSSMWKRWRSFGQGLVTPMKSLIGLLVSWLAIRWFSFFFLLKNLCLFFSDFLVT